MGISHNDVMKLLRIGKITGKDPLIRDYVLDGVAMKVKASGKVWAAKNYKSLKNEMIHQHSHMARRASEMGLPALTYTYAQGRNIGGLLGFLAGNEPVKAKKYPGVESKGDPPKPPKKGIIRKALWRKKKKSKYEPPE